MDDEIIEEFDGDREFQWLVNQLEIIIQENKSTLGKMGHIEYFNIINEFAVELVESGQAQEIKEFYDSLGGSHQQATLQRLIDPVISEYHEYIDKHSEIKTGKEARQYIEMYFELAELFTDILPQFIAVLQIVDNGEENYDDLKKMGLNDLLQKLGSKKYSRFNELTKGIDRELRNSIAHRDFTVDPVSEEIEFRDRGELVAKMDYIEFQNEFINILSLFTSVWSFQLMLTYYQLQNLVQLMDNLEEEMEE